MSRRWAALEEHLATLAEHDRRRTLRNWTAADAGTVTVDGRRLLDFASNDYLGLAGRVWTAGEAQDLLLAHGFTMAECATVLGALGRPGAGASRLVTGNDGAYALLERELARLKGAQAALVFTSGYTANVGVISALMRRGDAVFSDRLNHASIIDGITLSRAERHVYRHRDTAHLEALLQASRAERKLIVTDAVFSMDGTLAPLPELVRLKEKYGAWLMVDEAHSGGVFGDQGAGLAHRMGVAGQVDVLMGTLSKAFGSAGAYVAGDTVLIDYLLNTARSFIFTTGLPPSVIAAGLLNVLAARGMNAERAALQGAAAAFRAALLERGIDTAGSESQIVPALVRTDRRALHVAHELQEAGICAVAIRPPSVAPGAARVRFTLTAALGAETTRVALSGILDVIDRTFGAVGATPGPAGTRPAGHGRTLPNAERS